MYDCSKIIAVDISENKLKLATEFGATHTVNGGKCNPVQAIRDLTGGHGADYTVESAGRIEPLSKRSMQ